MYNLSYICLYQDNIPDASNFPPADSYDDKFTGIGTIMGTETTVSYFTCYAYNSTGTPTATPTSNPTKSPSPKPTVSPNTVAPTADNDGLSNNDGLIIGISIGGFLLLTILVLAVQLCRNAEGGWSEVRQEAQITDF